MKIYKVQFTIRMFFFLVYISIYIQLIIHKPKYSNKKVKNKGNI